MKSHLVRTLFSPVPKQYDLILALLSLGWDHAWRRITAAQIPTNARQILDVASGTGLMTFKLLQRTSGTVVSLDLTKAMLHYSLQRGRRIHAAHRVDFVLGVVEKLPFRSQVFDASITTLSLRNFADIESAFREMKRTTRSRGRIVALDFTKPSSLVFRRLYYVYLFQIMPRLGRLVSKYWETLLLWLAHSIHQSRSPHDIRRLLLNAGATAMVTRNVTAGIVALHVASS